MKPRKWQKRNGAAGNRTQDLSHARRALYQLSHNPEYGSTGKLTYASYMYTQIQPSNTNTLRYKVNQNTCNIFSEYYSTLYLVKAANLLSCIYTIHVVYFFPDISCSYVRYYYITNIVYIQYILCLLYVCLESYISS